MNHIVLAIGIMAATAAIGLGRDFLSRLSTGDRGDGRVVVSGWLRGWAAPYPAGFCYGRLVIDPDGPITFFTRFGRVRAVQLPHGGLVPIMSRRVGRTEISSYVASDMHSTVLVCVDGNGVQVEFAAPPGTGDPIRTALDATAGRSGPPGPVLIREVGLLRQLVGPATVLLVGIAAYLAAVAAAVPQSDPNQVKVEWMAAVFIGLCGLIGVLRRWIMRRREITQLTPDQVVKRL